MVKNYIVLNAEIFLVLLENPTAILLENSKIFEEKKDAICIGLLYFLRALSKLVVRLSFNLVEKEKQL